MLELPAAGPASGIPDVEGGNLMRVCAVSKIEPSCRYPLWATPRPGDAAGRYAAEQTRREEPR